MNEKSSRSTLFVSLALRKPAVLLLSLALVLLTAGLFLAEGTLQAQAAPSAAPDPDVWVTNGLVMSVFPAGNTTYIGGTFTYVGPYTGYGVPLDTSSGDPIQDYPKVNTGVSAAVPDGSGGWYIGGHFTQVGEVYRNRLAHILADGSVADWNPNADGTVYALALSGSTIYAGGVFTTIGGQPRNYLAAIDTSTGNPTTWDPNLDNAVLALAVSGSTLYVGGGFTSIQGSSGGPYTRNNIAAIDTTNGNPTAWNPNANYSIHALALSGSIVYAGGFFTSIQGSSGGPYARKYLAAIDSSTANPTAWDPNMDNAVRALALSGSTLYAGGDFTSIQGFSGGPYARNRIAAIDATTANPTVWDPNIDNSVRALAVSGSTVYAGGDFTSIQGFSGGPYARNRIAAIDATSGNPTAWDTGANESVVALALSGSTIYVGGSFYSIGGKTRNHIAAIDSDPTSPTYGHATAWNPGASSTVTAFAVSGSTVYVGGYFTSIQGSSGGPYARSYIAAIDASTGNPTSWNPGANDYVEALAVSGSTVYAGGRFTSIQGASGGPYTRNRLAAINASTGNPTSWNPNLNGMVRAVVISGSTIYAGGSFTSIQGSSGGPYARNYIAAIDASTGNPTSWNPGASATVRAIAIYGSTVYAGGHFTSIQGASGGPYTRNYIAAIDASTGNPTSWDPGANNWVFALTVSGSAVYAGGYFTSIQGSSGGPYTRYRIAAIGTSTGNPTTWNPNASNSVYALAASDSTIYAGGDFVYIGGPSKYFAAFNEPPSVTSITPDSGTNDGVVSITDLAGTGFRYGASVTLKRAGEADIDATNVSVVSDAQITCNLDLTGVAVGAWDVYIENSDGQSSTLAGVFSVEYPPPGTISGTATEEGTGDPIEDVQVRVYSVSTGKWTYNAYTASDGTYTTPLLPAGVYRLCFYPISGNYLYEWYENASSYSTATDITISGSDVVANASLAGGGTISGTITEEGSGTPINNCQVQIWSVATGKWTYNAYTRADGTYTTKILPPGTYRLRFYPRSGSWISEWYDSASSYSTATDVTVGMGSQLTRDAQLVLP